MKSVFLSNTNKHVDGSVQFLSSRLDKPLRSTISLFISSLLLTTAGINTVSAQVRISNTETTTQTLTAPTTVFVTGSVSTVDSHALDLKASGTWTVVNDGTLQSDFVTTQDPRPHALFSDVSGNIVNLTNNGNILTSFGLESDAVGLYNNAGATIINNGVIDGGHVDGFAAIHIESLANSGASYTIQNNATGTLSGGGMVLRCKAIKPKPGISLMMARYRQAIMARVFMPSVAQ